MRRINRAILIITGCCLFAAMRASAQEAMLWREVDPAHVAYIELQDGIVVVELNPLFAPETVARFKRLVVEDFYRGLSFYRVIEGFVAQGGFESDPNVPNPAVTIGAEFEIEWDGELPWTPVETRDLYGYETGFIDGFAAARDQHHAWLTHCPGVIAMARESEPDSARSDFYFVIGQAPRYLDRNLSIFGRVIHGMDAVQRIRRGPTELNGVIENDLERSRIVRIRMAADLEPEEQNAFYVMDTSSEGFRDYMQQRRHRKDAFFHHRPPAVLDVCQVPVATRVEKPDVREGQASPLHDSLAEAGEN